MRRDRRAGVLILLGFGSLHSDGSIWARALRSVLAIAIALLIPGCSHKSEDKGGAAEGEKAPESRIKHGTNGEVIVTLDTATQKGMGLQTAALSPTELGPEIKAYGRVLEAGTLASQVADLAAANATSQASQAELQRLRTLASQNNASQRALQTAEATAIRDQAQVESARLRLLASWGSAIASRPDLPSFAQSLATLSNVLVQLNLPAGEMPKTAPTGAQLFLLATNTSPLPAELLGPAPVVDPQMQGRGFLLLVSPNTAQLTPGAAVSGYLILPGEPQKGVLLPREAVVRYNGDTWVYRQSSDQTFERISVLLQQPLPQGWFVLQGLKPGDKVVTTGAQLLLSEELKSQSGA